MSVLGPLIRFLDLPYLCFSRGPAFALERLPVPGLTALRLRRQTPCARGPFKAGSAPSRPRVGPGAPSFRRLSASAPSPPRRGRDGCGCPEGRRAAAQPAQRVRNPHPPTAGARWLDRGAGTTGAWAAAGAELRGLLNRERSRDPDAWV